VSVAQVPVARTDMGPPAPPGDAPAEPSTHTRWQPALVGSLALIAAALAGLWGLRRFGPRLRAWRQARRQAWEPSEPASFLRLKRACLAGDAATAYREFGIWARCEGCKTSPSPMRARAHPSFRSRQTRGASLRRRAHPLEWPGALERGCERPRIASCGRSWQPPQAGGIAGAQSVGVCNCLVARKVSDGASASAIRCVF
jgi:hypothetical protein